MRKPKAASRGTLPAVSGTLPAGDAAARSRLLAEPFNPDLVRLNRKRFSVTQGEVEAFYDALRLGQWGDVIRMTDAPEAGAVLLGGWAGRGDAYWHEVAAREVAHLQAGASPAVHDGCAGWSVAQQAAAEAEGWTVFRCGGEGSSAFKLCRTDASQVLADDVAAGQHVWREARKGQALHRAALAFLAEYSPEEASAIQRVGEAGG